VELSAVTSAMNEAASQNVLAVKAVPPLARVLKGSRAPSAQAAKMLSLLVAWNKTGGNVLDLDNDGKVDTTQATRSSRPPGPRSPTRSRGR
jgi:hypothetical protein